MKHKVKFLTHIVGAEFHFKEGCVYTFDDDDFVPIYDFSDAGWVEILESYDDPAELAKQAAQRQIVEDLKKAEEEAKRTRTIKKGRKNGKSTETDDNE